MYCLGRIFGLGWYGNECSLRLCGDGSTPSATTAHNRVTPFIINTDNQTSNTMPYPKVTPPRPPELSAAASYGLVRRQRQIRVVALLLPRLRLLPSLRLLIHVVRVLMLVVFVVVGVPVLSCGDPWSLLVVHAGSRS
jgi:hypothetical protein